MAPSFNLISEPWVPCAMLDGTFCELGLRDALARAHEIREVRDNSPLVTAALHRLLLAILHRNFGPANRDGWTALWSQGRYDAGILDDYWTRWADRFDLYDSGRPFYQTRTEAVLHAPVHSPAKLAHELASGNNDTLFDHSCSDRLCLLMAGQAARQLVAVQGYALPGGKSSPSNFTEAPLAAGAVILLQGQSLFATLMANLVQHNINSPFPGNERDCPTWEQDVQRTPERKARRPNGYLDYLTWQSRRVLLGFSPSGSVQSVRFLQGHAIDATNIMDPMMAFVHRDRVRGFLPLRILMDRAVWRDSHVFLMQTPNTHRMPGAVAQLASLARALPELASRHFTLNIIGLCLGTPQAKIHLWRHEQMPLPVQYLEDPALLGDLQGTLFLAENTAEELRGALWTLAEKLLEPPGEGSRKPDRKVVGKLLRSFPALTHFWAALEAPFYEVFVSLAEEPDSRDAAEEDWRYLLRKTARASLAMAVDSVGGSARALRAATEAEQRLGRGLKKVLGERKEVVEHA